MATKPHLKITLTRGLVAKRYSQEKVIKGLGLRKFGSSVVHADSPTIRGMINKVHHLVTVVPDANATLTKKKSEAKTKTATKTATKIAKNEGKTSHAKKAESNS